MQVVKKSFGKFSYLNLCGWTTLRQQSCVIVVSLVLLDLVNVTSVDRIARSQDVDDMLGLRRRTLPQTSNTYVSDHTQADNEKQNNSS